MRSRTTVAIETPRRAASAEISLNSLFGIEKLIFFVTEDRSAKPLASVLRKFPVLDDEIISALPSLPRKQRTPAQQIIHESRGTIASAEPYCFGPRPPIKKPNHTEDYLLRRSGGRDQPFTASKAFTRRNVDSGIPARFAASISMLRWPSVKRTVIRLSPCGVSDSFFI